MTLDELKDALDYDPMTGVFLWRINKRGPGAKAGKVAGRVGNYGYRLIKFNGFTYQAHRLAWFYMTGDWPPEHVDHIDRDRLNNRWLNLRSATNKQNHENLGIIRTNTSGHKGVRWDSHRGKWFAYITHNQRMHNLGRYDDLSDALAARSNAVSQMFTHAPR